MNEPSKGPSINMLIHQAAGVLLPMLANSLIKFSANWITGFVAAIAITIITKTGSINFLSPKDILSRYPNKAPVPCIAIKAINRGINQIANTTSISPK